MNGLLKKKDVVSMVNNLLLPGAAMDLDNLIKYVSMVDGSRLAGSIGPDMVTNLITQNITAKLSEAFAIWPDTWKSWVATDGSDYTDKQVRTVVAQLGMIASLKETGGRIQEMAPPKASEVEFEIEGFGGILPIDMRVQKSDRLKYFSQIGDRLGRAGVSRLHEYIYITQLQASPALTDGSLLFAHNNDLNPSVGTHLTYPALEEALLRFSAMRDTSGEPYVTGRKVYLVCGPENEERALQLTKNKKKPGTVNDEINTLGTRIVGVDMSQKLEWDWYLVVDKSELNGLALSFYRGEKEPKVVAESKASTYQFENVGTQRWRVDHWYGGTWENPAVVRGSINKKPV